MDHLWQSSKERNQWECLRCGAVVPHEVTATAPKAEHMAHANHHGSSPNVVQFVRDLGEVCHGGGSITAEQLQHNHL